MPDQLFGPPIIRAKTMQEQLADYFTGRKYDQDPTMLNALAALIAPLTGLAPGPGKAAMLPNLRPIGERNLRTAMEYLGDRDKMSRLISLQGNPDLTESILDNVDALNAKLVRGEPTVMRRINPELAEPGQRTVRREGVREYVEQAGNGGEFVNSFIGHAPGSYNPFVYKIGPRFIIGDGHHRTSANLLLNRPSLSQVFDVDALMRTWQEQKDSGNITYRTLQEMLQRFREGRR